MLGWAVSMGEKSKLDIQRKFELSDSKDCIL